MSADIGRVSIGIAMFGPARWPCQYWDCHVWAGTLAGPYYVYSSVTMIFSILSPCSMRSTVSTPSTTFPKQV